MKKGLVIFLVAMMAVSASACMTKTSQLVKDESASLASEKHHGASGENGNITLVSKTKAESIQLPVSNIFQNPQLPQGCEVTSLVIVMNYKGYKVDKCVLSDNYLPKWPNLSGDPEMYYLREPRSDGWYCFAGALCSTINNYCADTGANVPYRNLTGTDVENLYSEVENGNPVVVWGTLQWQTPRANGTHYVNLHCMVLSGFTDSTVTITDPIYGVTTVDRNRFESVWHKMGSRALVVE